MSLASTATTSTPPNSLSSAGLRERQALLARTSLFQGLAPMALDELAAALRTRRYRPGALLCSRQQAGEELSILYSGEVKVSLIEDGGREVTLAVLRAGDFFGEMSLCDGGGQSADVIALGPVTVLALPRFAFRACLERHPAVAAALLAELARRLRAADEAIATLALYEVNDRLVRTLCALARREGERVGDGFFLPRRPTQQELAGMIGACRETVSRALSALVRRGLVIPQGRNGRALVLTARLVEMAGAIS